MSEAVWAESVWNVFLRLSLISCPVRLVPATAPIDREFETLLSESGGIIDLTRFVRGDRSRARASAPAMTSTRTVRSRPRRSTRC